MGLANWDEVTRSGRQRDLGFEDCCDARVIRRDGPQHAVGRTSFWANAILAKGRDHQRGRANNSYPTTFHLNVLLRVRGITDWFLPARVLGPAADSSYFTATGIPRRRKGPWFYCAEKQEVLERNTYAGC